MSSVPFKKTPFLDEFLGHRVLLCGSEVRVCGPGRAHKPCMNRDFFMYHPEPIAVLRISVIICTLICVFKLSYCCLNFIAGLLGL
jgi:hypothetical protein